MKKNYFKWLVFMFFSITTVLAQENSISGLVTDTSGEPLIGVNIIEDGTNNGTQTDFDGYFTLNVDAEKTIVFSFIGYVYLLNEKFQIRITVMMCNFRKTPLSFKK